jgi:hypothetical protein
MNFRIRTLVASGFLLLLGACSRQESVREIDWAKAALARNPDYEIIATDESAGTFAVRNTVTGRFEKLSLQDLIASPLPARPAAQPAPAPATPPAPAPSEPVESPAANEPEKSLASNQTTVPFESAPGNGHAEGPGYSIHRSDAAPAAAPASSLEGPGYSITRQEPAKRPASPEAFASNAEIRTDPIVCQGDRLMRIDGETIEFSGDAVIAEKGCDLYISNARIRAGGVGIIARQARVHIVNSTIGGSRGSYEASEGAEIYVARTTFSGIGRRFDSATMNDLGGNAYE